VITNGCFRISAPKAENGFIAARIVSSIRRDETLAGKVQRFQANDAWKTNVNWRAGGVFSLPGQSSEGRASPVHWLTTATISGAIVTTGDPQ
jgi:hypothetical protein